MTNFRCISISLEEGVHGLVQHNEAMCKNGKGDCKPRECRKHWKKKCDYEHPLTHMLFFVNNRVIAATAL